MLDLLRSRGLIIRDEIEASHYLRFIGYYRLSGYGHPLTLKSGSGTHTFKPGATFEDILNLYKFDRELRLLVMDAIERVEVAVRACVSDYMCEKGGPHWYFDVKNFIHAKSADEFRTKVIEETGYKGTGATKGKDVFLQHYFNKYTDPALPPSWMVAEVLSITAWSKAFESLPREDRKRVSAYFGMNPEVLESWLHAVCYVRNLCAHHSRLWNREFTIRPMVAKGYEHHLSNNARFYAQAFVINCLLKTASPKSKWWERLDELIQSHRFIDPVAIGFPSLEP